MYEREWYEGDSGGMRLTFVPAVGVAAVPAAAVPEGEVAVVAGTSLGDELPLDVSCVDG